MGGWIRQGVDCKPVADNMELLYLDDALPHDKVARDKEVPNPFRQWHNNNRQSKDTRFPAYADQICSRVESILPTALAKTAQRLFLGVLVADGAGAIAGAVNLPWPMATLQNCVLQNNGKSLTRAQSYLLKESS